MFCKNISICALICNNPVEMNTNPVDFCLVGAHIQRFYNRMPPEGNSPGIEIKEWHYLMKLIRVMVKLRSLRKIFPE